MKALKGKKEKGKMEIIPISRMEERNNGKMENPPFQFSIIPVFQAVENILERE
jgi:hypothetical protein